MENIRKLNHYDIFEVIDTFDIDKIFGCQTLKNWLGAIGKLNSFEEEILSKVRSNLEIKWDEWNEEELKMNFISFVFFVAQI